MAPVIALIIELQGELNESRVIAGRGDAAEITRTAVRHDPSRIKARQEGWPLRIQALPEAKQEARQRRR